MERRERRPTSKKEVEKGKSREKKIGPDEEMLPFRKMRIIYSLFTFLFASPDVLKHGKKRQTFRRLLTC